MEAKQPDPASHTIRAAAAYFGLVFGVGMVLGSIRVPFLVPRLGVRTSELLEMPLMLGATVWSARFVVRRFGLGSKPAPRLTVGCLALGFLLAAEIAVTYLLQGQTLKEYIASRDAISGSIYVLMLVVFALMPLLVLRGSNTSLERARER